MWRAAACAIVTADETREILINKENGMGTRGAAGSARHTLAGRYDCAPKSFRGVGAAACYGFQA
jgi:hypothetical protein